MANDARFETVWRYLEESKKKPCETVRTENIIKLLEKEKKSTTKPIPNFLLEELLKKAIEVANVLIDDAIDKYSTGANTNITDSEWGLYRVAKSTASVYYYQLPNDVTKESSTSSVKKYDTASITRENTIYKLIELISQRDLHKNLGTEIFGATKKKKKKKKKKVTWGANHTTTYEQAYFSLLVRESKVFSKEKVVVGALTQAFKNTTLDIKSVLAAVNKFQENAYKKSSKVSNTRDPENVTYNDDVKTALFGNGESNLSSTTTGQLTAYNLKTNADENKTREALTIKTTAKKDDSGELHELVLSISDDIFNPKDENDAVDALRTIAWLQDMALVISAKTGIDDPEVCSNTPQDALDMALLLCSKGLRPRFDKVTEALIDTSKANLTNYNVYEEYMQHRAQGAIQEAYDCMAKYLESKDLTAYCGLNSDKLTGITSGNRIEDSDPDLQQAKDVKARNIKHGRKHLK